MPKNLLIVESPAKAKTISQYLGPDFEVQSSYGHVRDLPRKNLSIDTDNGFKPTYEVPSDKKKVISNLKKHSKDKQSIWLATDEDREGEAIAWHLYEVLKLKPDNTKRIAFHEITKDALANAIKNPRTINRQLVDAQQARRVLDRLVGYELSPVLWRKVKTGLSAGRVQSVAVRLVVEREQEIEQFNYSSIFKIRSIFEHKSGTIPAELVNPPASLDETKHLLESLVSKKFSIKDISQKSSRRNPSAPFTTSSLQQEAANRLGYSVKQTMVLAQRLYENGLITYMRTDSVNLSGSAIKAAERYIRRELGKRYHQARQYQTKTKSAQEAHESIRPTSIEKSSAGADDRQKKLYKLIWQRTIASQMSAAETEKTDITITDKEDGKLVFLAKGETLKFDGFMKVYGGARDDVILPKVKIGDKLDLDEAEAIEHFPRPPGRYSEASLVKKLEELGIGRPSTYAPTISTIQTRGYVEKGDREGPELKIRKIKLKQGKISEAPIESTKHIDRNKLIPTPLATLTNDFLTKYFTEILDYQFTANVEGEFDQIAHGKLAWPDMISHFYDRFAPLVEKSTHVSRKEVAHTRLIGDDPGTGQPIYARFGKYGPMLQRGDPDSEEKPHFTQMPDNKTIQNITLEEALEMFKLPRLVGHSDDGEPIWANNGRFGPYIKVKDTFVSIKPHDPRSIDETLAKKLYQEKLEADKNKFIKKFDGGINVVNGPFGPYVTDGKKNAKVPKDHDPKNISLDQAKELLKKGRPKRNRR